MKKETLEAIEHIIEQHVDYADAHGVDTYTEEGKEVYNATDNWVRLYKELKKQELEEKKERNVLIKTCIIGGVVCFCVVVTVNGEVVGNYIARTATQLLGVLMRIMPF